MQTDNLTGSLISLITNAQVRYEGTLIEINRVERSMNLQNVRSFGTEGRRDGKNEISAHENTIPSVIFKVDHVKDFSIIKRPEPTETKPKKPELQEQDPAIINAQEEDQKNSGSKQKEETAATPQPQSTENEEAKQPSSSYGAHRKGGPPNQ